MFQFCNASETLKGLYTLSDSESTSRRISEKSRRVVQRQRTAPWGSFWGPPLKARGALSLGFFERVWQSACVLLRPCSLALALCLQGRRTPRRAGHSASAAVSRVGLGHWAHPLALRFGSVLQIQAAKEEGCISIPAKKLPMFDLGKVHVLGQEKGQSPRHPWIIKAWLRFRFHTCGLQFCKILCGKTGRRLFYQLPFFFLTIFPS